MALIDIHRLLFRRLEELTFSPALMISWPFKEFIAPIKEFWLEVQVETTGTTNPYLETGDRARLTGILQVTVMAPLYSGSSPSVEIAQRVANHFPDDLLLHGSGYRVSVTKTPHIVSTYRDDLYLRTPVLVDWHVNP